MESVIVFDRNGNSVDLNEVIINFLKNNLKVYVDTKTEKDCDSENIYTYTTVKISLNDDEICSWEG